MKHSSFGTMGIGVYMLFGAIKIEDREETDYDGQCYITLFWLGGANLPPPPLVDFFK